MFFLLQNEGNKQKINVCDEQIDGKVQQTNIVNDVEERRWLALQVCGDLSLSLI